LVFTAPGEAATAATSFSSVTGTGLNVNILGQTLTTDLSLARSADGLSLTASNAQLSLSDGNGNVSSRGPPFLQLTNGAGSLDISSSGVSGGLSGTVALSLPGVSLGGTFELLLNTTAQPATTELNGSSTSLPAGPYFKLTGTGASITVGGQTLSGD